MEADKIIVLEDGKIVEMGNHDELINNQQIYYKIWQIKAFLKGGINVEEFQEQNLRKVLITNLEKIFQYMKPLKTYYIRYYLCRPNWCIRCHISYYFTQRFRLC